MTTTKWFARVMKSEGLTDEDDGEHVPGRGKHARRAQHREVKHLPATPVTEPT